MGWVYTQLTEHWLSISEAQRFIISMKNKVIYLDMVAYAACPTESIQKQCGPSFILLRCFHFIV